MSGFVITVDFRLKPGAMAAFRRLIDANAIASCHEEPGCRRFDVLAPQDEPDRVFLYEIYEDKPAFDAHLKTAHFAQFNRDSAELVLSKTVASYSLACEGTDPEKH
ncbi:MAG: putative quinol monooxygenase [Aestuariivirga sp.]|jgi:quinol monooxygenase YgiN